MQIFDPGNVAAAVQSVRDGSIVGYISDYTEVQYHAQVHGSWKSPASDSKFRMVHAAL
jgi:hypothetical protein